MDAVMANASRGAAMLDVESPGWFNSIDTETLNMLDVDLCILGQLFNGYHDGTRWLSSLSKYDAFTVETMGFTFYAKGDDSGFNTDEQFALLDLAWILLINDRRAEAAEASDCGDFNCEGCYDGYYECDSLN
jgi:hypothetical protein